MIGRIAGWPIRRAARSASRRRDWVEAARLYARLIAHGGATARDRVQHGHSLKEAGDTTAAEEAYRAAARLFPLDVDAPRHLGLLLRRRGRNADAILALGRALCLAPDALDLAAELADLGVADDQLDERLIPALLSGEGDRAVLPSPGPAAALRRLLARRAARRREWDVAARHYRALLRQVPGQPQMLVQLGHAHRGLGDSEGARAAYLRALALSPRVADTYLHLGHALKAMGRQEAATQAYLTAWRLQPALPAAAAELLERDWTRADLDRLTTLTWGFSDPRSVGLPTDPSPGERARAGFLEPSAMVPRQRSIWLYLAAELAHRD